MQENTKILLSINERIIYIIDYYGSTRYKLAKETGISQTVLLNIYKGKNKPSVDFIEKLLNKYTAIDANWLVMGIGEIMKNQVIDESYPDKKNPPGPCPNCSAINDVLNATKQALLHAESEIDVRKEVTILLTEKVNELKDKISTFEGAHEGQKRKSA